MRRVLFVLSAAALAASSPAPAGTRPAPARTLTPLGVSATLALADASHALLALDRRRGASATSLFRRHGGVLVSRRLGVWRLPAAAARTLVPTLTEAGALRAVEPDQLAVPAGHFAAGDPLVPAQWWIRAVGADLVEPPGPGRPVTVIDDGLDTSHPEFAGRPNTTLLNAQSTLARDNDDHGTAVTSVAAAPANGAGVVGIYPRAALRAYDAGSLRVSDVVAGIERSVAAGPAVISISLAFGSFSAILEEAVLVAFGTGSLVVAAAGNDFQRGNPVSYPAALNHVLTIAATDRQDNSSNFSNRALSVDLAAPGEDIPVAVPTWRNAAGYATNDGTSFSAPLVAGAAAWVWTVRPDLHHTQLFDLLRHTARDVWERGFDSDTGFGLLNVPAALTSQAPSTDHQEPNDDVDHVRPGGLFRNGDTPLTSPRRRRATISARLDVTEDPEDVYRVWVPGRRAVRIDVTPDADVDVELWQPGTRTVRARGAARRRYLIDSSARSGRRTDSVSAVNRARRGAFVYLDVFLPRNGPLTAGYRVSVRTTLP